MSNGDGGARGRLDLTKETYVARALYYAEPEHTDVHDRGSRLMELLQDAVVLEFQRESPLGLASTGRTKER